MASRNYFPSEELDRWVSLNIKAYHLAQREPRDMHDVMQHEPWSLRGEDKKYLLTCLKHFTIMFTLQWHTSTGCTNQP
jgi:hypothetical protein